MIIWSSKIYGSIYWFTDVELSVSTYTFIKIKCTYVSKLENSLYLKSKFFVIISLAQADTYLKSEIKSSNVSTFFFFFLRKGLSNVSTCYLIKEGNKNK